MEGSDRYHKKIAKVTCYRKKFDLIRQKNFINNKTVS